MAGIPLPTLGAIPPFEPDTGPTYTQIFNDTVGTLGSDADGFPQLFAQLTALSSAFGVELAADQGIGPIATLGGVPGILDPAPLDGTIGNYVATIPTGEGIVTDIGGASPPDLNELPMASTFGEGISGVPGQLLHDFGTVKLNSPTQTFRIGQELITSTRVLEMISADQISGDTSVLNEVDDDQTSGPDGTGPIYHNMVMTPVKVGAFEAQVNTIGGTATGIAIWTFRVNVVP